MDGDSPMPGQLDLPPLELLTLALDSLPPIDSSFRLPHLADKPQNPVLDSLHLWQHNHGRGTVYQTFALDDVHIFEEPPVREEIRHLYEETAAARQERADLWQEAVQEASLTQQLVMSWDALRTSAPRHQYPPSFLSEQSSLVSSATKSYALPHLQNPLETRRHVPVESLKEALRLTVTGMSSFLYVWDLASQSFILQGLSFRQRGIVTIMGKDDVISESTLNRFTLIGTLARRLDTFVAKHRASTQTPIFHAFTHALSSTLAHTIDAISKSALFSDEYEETSEAFALAKLWASYAEVQEELEELCLLCGISNKLSPAQYQPLPGSDTDLLSHLYDQLQVRIERQSPRHITAQFAFIFSTAAHVYCDSICAWVGYGHCLISSGFSPVEASNQVNLVTTFGDSVEEGENDTYPTDAEEGGFPAFLSDHLGTSLVRARKSLALLRSARPDHPVLTIPSTSHPIRWFWASAEVEAALEGQYPNAPPALRSNLGPVRSHLGDGLSVFQVFDLEPGFPSHSMSDPPSTTYGYFRGTFPLCLPSLTPTLPDLTNLVLKPLISHINALSGALVDVFLSPSAYLYFPSHLRLLKSYLLLASSAFKSTLESTLFSDTYGGEDQTFQQARVRRLHSAPLSLTHSETVKWTVGLSPALTPDGAWPPGGTSLSFLLRTVIVDSLNLDYRHVEDTATGTEVRKVLHEAEWRLGFALRDLPVNGGVAKWLDARSIEALDFLYMEYQPPGPLRTLITLAVMSKYHRIFAFNLRLMRVDNVVRALFRMSRSSSVPMFPTFSTSRRLFFHFRFVSHAFVTSLSSYIYDTAIKSNYDPFLATLSPTSKRLATQFTDVFSLAEYHSFVMDEVLSACLLRSGQKAAGDLLRSALAIVLEFGVLVGDLFAGQVKEYQAVSRLEALYKKFRTTVVTLVKVLTALVERGVPTRQESTMPQAQPILPASRTLECLSDLLIRIDITDWWKNHPSRRYDS